MLALLLGGCVTVPEFRALEREVMQIKRGGPPATAAIGGTNAPPNERLADLGAEVTELREEVARLRGELEEVRHVSDLALEEARAQSSAPAPRAQTTPDPGAPSDLGPATTRTTRPAPVEVPLTEEVRAYEEAFRFYRAGDYRASIERFRGFLDLYGESDYADNALFWLGECYFKLGDHERAVLAFEDVTKRYPDGNKVPDALYRQGIALLEIGKRTGQEEAYGPAARDVFERILRDYPSSERVPEARRQLEKFGT